MNVLAIIPARGGSKGVPFKNIRKIGGFPLIYYSIQTAKASSLITDFFVNTDCDEIERVCKDYNCQIIRRSPILGDDDAKIVDVLLESLNNAQERTKVIYDIVILLQPTSLFRLGTDIDNVINLISNNVHFEGVVSVVRGEDFHPSRLYRLNTEHELESLDKKNEQVQRQMLDPLYYRNGCIYAVRSKVLLDQKTLMPQNKSAYIMPDHFHVNIDTEKDFLIAEALLPFFNFSPEQ